MNKIMFISTILHDMSTKNTLPEGQFDSIGLILVYNKVKEEDARGSGFFCIFTGLSGGSTAPCAGPGRAVFPHAF